MPYLILIHTSATLVLPFQQLCRQYLPGVKVTNIVDDSLIATVIEENKLSSITARRVAQHIFNAQDAGADMIMVTCSSIGPAVDASAQFCRIPVLRVDQPMADRAVATGPRIGVIATLATTLQPTAALIQRRAVDAGVRVNIRSVICEGAFSALMSGDAESHDGEVLRSLKQLLPQCDVVVLAQASMARVVDANPDLQGAVPILASPTIALQHLAAVLLPSPTDIQI